MGQQEAIKGVGSCIAAAMECGSQVSRPAAVTAIPPLSYRQPRNSKIAYRYVTDPEAMRLAVDDIERQLKIERKVLWWAVANGRRQTAANTRSWIDYAETARRNGLARLSQLQQKEG